MELPSPTFLKGPARAGAGQRWPHPVGGRPTQGRTLVARCRGWALLVAKVPSGLRARRQPLHSPSALPVLPAPPSLPPSFAALFPPSCSPSPPSLPSLSTAEAPTPEGTEADAGSSNRRRHGTSGPGVASAWPRRERGPSCWDPSGEWGHGPTASPRPACSRTPPLFSGGRLDTRKGFRVGWGGGVGERKAGWVAGAALRPFCPLGSSNKARFRDQFCGGWSIQRMRLSWRWGRERKPKMVRTGPGSGGAAKEPQSRLQGGRSCRPNCLLGSASRSPPPFV